MNPDLQGIDMDDLSNPWKAATSSAIAFVVGAGVFLPAPPPHNFIPKIDLQSTRSPLDPISHDALPSPQACGKHMHVAGIPLLASAFVHDHTARLISLSVASTFALAAFGAIGAWLGGASKFWPAARVLIGGWLAMSITFAFGKAFASINSS